MFVDFCAVVMGLTGAYLLRMFGYDLLHAPAPATLLPFSLQFNLGIQVGILMVLVLGINGRYNLFNHFASKNIFQSFWAFSGGFMLLVVFFFFSKIHFFSRLILGLSWILGFVFLIAGEHFLKKIQKRFWKKGIGKIKIILLGTGIIAEKLKKNLRKNEQFELVHHLSEGQFRSLKRYIRESSPDEIVLASEKTDDVKVADLAHIAHAYNVQFSFAPDELALDLASVYPFEINGMPLLQLNATKLFGWGKVIKGIVDRIFAFFSLVLLSPIFLIISLLIWKEEKDAPVIYVSKRIGKNGKLFGCYKFRSMVKNADHLKKNLLQKNERKGGVLFKIKNDPRITPLGKFLRKWSLDELPQLINVLKGDMSLIGPRPHLPEEVEKYSEKDRYLFNIKPGITGLTQIQKESSGDLGFEQEMKVELFYLKNWSFWLDIAIFFRTLKIIFQGKNS